MYVYLIRAKHQVDKLIFFDDQRHTSNDPSRALFQDGCASVGAGVSHRMIANATTPISHRISACISIGVSMANGIWLGEEERDAGAG